METMSAPSEAGSATAAALKFERRAEEFEVKRFAGLTGFQSAREVARGPGLNGTFAAAAAAAACCEAHFRAVDCFCFSCSCRFVFISFFVLFHFR